MEKHLQLNRIATYFISLNIIFIIMVSCNMNTKCEKKRFLNQQISNGHHFYDFNFSLLVYNNPQVVSKELTYHYFPENNDKELLKVIFNNYYDENNIKFKKPIKHVFYISKGKLDTIYNFIVKNITPNILTNTTDEKIPPPPTPNNEWEYSTIELDLLYRGDKYLTTTNNTEIFNELLLFLSPYEKTDNK